MAKGRSCICPVCLKPVDKEDGFEYKGKYYHEKCFNQFSKQETREKNKQIKEKKQVEKIKKDIQKETHISNEVNLSDEDILAKEKTINYLKKLLNVTQLSAKTYKLLKTYYSTYKFSYEGMYITLKYFYEILDNPIVSDCMGIVPYIYEEAQDYEKTKNDAHKNFEDIDINNIVLNKTVQVKKPINEKDNKLIDISTIGVN